MGERIGVETIGDESVGFRMERGSKGFIVLWRYGRVLARCGALGLDASSLREVFILARLQQRRMTGALG